MATLTKSTGTVTLTGAVEKVTLPAVYGWVWVKNMSDSDIFAGLSADISEGADGVMTIPAGECGRIQTDGFSSVYLLGTGNALVVAQNYADCPFKAGAKGGESSAGFGWQKIGTYSYSGSGSQATVSVPDLLTHKLFLVVAIYQGDNKNSSASAIYSIENIGKYNYFKLLYNDGASENLIKIRISYTGGGSPTNDIYVSSGGKTYFEFYAQ